jgi:ribosomal protein S18 acetylase RimI-like enzyme
VSEHTTPADGGEHGEQGEQGGAAVIVAVHAVDDELVEAFTRLIPQLSSSSPPPSHDHLTALVDSEDTVLFVARIDGRILGSLTLALYRIPTGTKAWIEDVVVDAEARGHGVGELLNRAALEEARARGAKDVSLTSRPSREAANRLYRRIGFEPRETNVYRYTL